MTDNTNRKNVPKTYTGDDGKFAAGNPGRPKGARHKTTQAVEAMLEGEAEGLTRRAIELALDGDTTALRLCLERIAPVRKDSPITFDLPPIRSAADASEAVQAVLQAVSGGQITPLEASTVMALLGEFRRVLETTDLEARITALEDKRTCKPRFKGTLT